MAERNLLRIALLLSAFLCVAPAKSAGQLAQTPTRPPSPGAAHKPCAATTDAETVAAIHAKIKADHRFDEQWGHINVSSRNRVVTLTGWVNDRDQQSALIKYARSTYCVRRVKWWKLLFPFIHTGCPTGMKPCGDICIGRNDTCNLIQ